MFFTDNRRTNELLYEIQISWPSGLIIRPVEYHDADFPFYILQYYSVKVLEYKIIKNETHRKYLHNGDVVKFFNDGSVIVLRPNGTIITIISFKNGKLIKKFNFSH
jgi:antitoxin component YwqK of YwqJK toxin-antitoxin module